MILLKKYIGYRVKKDRSITLLVLGWNSVCSNFKLLVSSLGLPQQCCTAVISTINLNDNKILSLIILSIQKKILLAFIRNYFNTILPAFHQSNHQQPITNVHQLILLVKYWAVYGTTKSKENVQSRTLL